jgi:hypothetical protein|tara:strand:+ start:1213 stop:1749 length:537 start_codon:yes stop_codon:yes gene_type:complete
MNIFYLSEDATECAKQHCDKHTVKMILEYAQMLSTAHRVLDGDEYADTHNLYKIAHKNHPSTIWARSSSLNYRYLYDLFVALCDEYTKRYEKRHTTDSKLRVPLAMPPKALLYFRVGFTEPPQCMPEECKVPDNAIEAYRNYYRQYKKSFAKWYKSETSGPGWFYSEGTDLDTYPLFH